ncbi:uncharacterized protein PAC_07113 [Phialocephala subalpina]|uniref:Uncharacterized protein n=1 Tax=Phialocephala subalpina TaxID=576137 RepID=A0A1L7WWT1_9HELO|nr:uncharacterized protein PAC_07113 [Phialocephala subalpina]
MIFLIRTKLWIKSSTRPLPRSSSTQRETHKSVLNACATMAFQHLDALQKQLDGIGAVNRHRPEEDNALHAKFEQVQAKIESDKETKLPRHKAERDARDAQKDEVIRKEAETAQLEKEGLIGVFKTREDELTAKFKEDQNDPKFKREIEDCRKGAEALKFLPERSRLADDIRNQQAQQAIQASTESQPSQGKSSTTAELPSSNPPERQRDRPLGRSRGSSPARRSRGLSPGRARGLSPGRRRDISPWRYRDETPRSSTARSPPRYRSPTDTNPNDRVPPVPRPTVRTMMLQMVPDNPDNHPPNKTSSIPTGPRADNRPEYKRARQESGGYQQTLASRPGGSRNATPAASSPTNANKTPAQSAGPVAPTMFTNTTFHPSIPPVVGVCRVEPKLMPEPPTKATPNVMPKPTSTTTKSVNTESPLHNGKNPTVESAKATAGPAKALQTLPRKLSTSGQTGKLVTQAEKSTVAKDRKLSQTINNQYPQLRAPSVAPAVKTPTHPKKQQVNTKAIPVNWAPSTAPAVQAPTPLKKENTEPQPVASRAETPKLQKQTATTAQAGAPPVKYTRAPPPPSPLREPTSKKLVNYKLIGRRVQPQTYLQADPPKSFPVHQVKYNAKDGELIEWTACATSTPIRAAELRESGEAYKGYIPSKDLLKQDGWHILPGTIKEIEYFPEWAIIHVIRLDKEDCQVLDSWIKFRGKQVMQEFLSAFGTGWRLNIVIPKEIDEVPTDPMAKLMDRVVKKMVVKEKTAKEKMAKEKGTLKTGKVKMGMFV